MVESVFWFSLFALGYTYVGYPFVLWVWARIGSRQASQASQESFVPPVSIVIAARNEEQHIARRIEDCLNVDYPADRVEVIVISDGSTDGTVDIIQRYAGHRVRPVILRDRLGKAAALNRGVAEARGDIILFTDARQTFNKSAVRELVAGFCDPRVGAVSGELVLVKEQGGAPLHNAIVLAV